MSRRDFTGKILLISGAAGGLGTALCHRFGAAGARIAAMDMDPGRLDALMAALHAKRIKALALPGNITERAACEGAVQATLSHFGVLDGLINNAGISHRSLLRNTDPAVIRRVMEVNFLGALYLTHAALPHITARRGVIAAISSVAGYSPLIGRTGYSASKHALHGFFDSLRSEVEGAGVGVTLVCPSFINTGIGAAALDGGGVPVSGPRITSGGESSAREIAERIFAAIAEDRRLLLPDRTSKLAWWLSKLMPATYARAMKRRVGAEFPDVPG